MSDEDLTPGSPRWYLTRMTQRLLSRQDRYDRLERYAQGNHDLPNGDKRFVVALRELQKKCRTNYCELVIKAVTQRMEVIGFQFGPEQQVDEEAKSIWYYNDMDVQSQIIINTAATFGDAYIMVTPPLEDVEDENKEPIISAEDPRMCITESDPRYVTKTLAGLKMWQDDLTGLIKAVLYMPDKIYEYEGPAITDVVGTDSTNLTHLLVGRSVAAGGFMLVRVQPNTLGEVPLVRINWQPAFGTMGRAEIENVMDIQDRINHTILDRLVVSKAQAYNQRWMTGGTKGDNFRPGADMVWATMDAEAKFGQFEAVDLTQLLAAVRDDVGDMAAVSQTPATYLMNRMVNVSGDTLTQDQSALVGKVKLREKAAGWGFARAMRLAFAAKGNTTKSKETEVCTLWKNAQIHTLAELADSFTKFTGGGVPLDIAMQMTGLFTNDQIESAKEQFEAAQLAAQEMELEKGAQAEDGDMAVAKQQGVNAVQAAKAKPKPAKPGGKPKPKPSKPKSY